jgi:hypothetical protein
MAAYGYTKKPNPSRWCGNLPWDFYDAPQRARLLVSSRREANEIIMHYDGRAPTYIGLGVWRLVAKSAGAGTYEITCREVKYS